MAKEYGVHIGESYLTGNWENQPVILRDETVFSTDDDGHIIVKTTTEVVINSDPSEAEIFKYRLKQGL